jgi:hypothetical protein
VGDDHERASADRCPAAERCSIINPRVTAHGEQILIETVETSGAEERKRSRLEFAQMPLSWAAETAKAAGTPGAMVWVLLVYMAWCNKSPTFPQSNVMLALWNSPRDQTPDPAQAEKAGRIKITRRPNRSPMITLLNTSGIKDFKAKICHVVGQALRWVPMGATGSVT